MALSRSYQYHPRVVRHSQPNPPQWRVRSQAYHDHACGIPTFKALFLSNRGRWSRVSLYAWLGYINADHPVNFDLSLFWALECNKRKCPCAQPTKTCTYPPLPATWFNCPLLKAHITSSKLSKLSIPSTSSDSAAGASTTRHAMMEVFSLHGILGVRVFAAANAQEPRMYDQVGCRPCMGQTSIGAGLGVLWRGIWRGGG